MANAIQEVRNGKAEFERDGFLFYEKDYNYPLLSAFFLAFNSLDNTRPAHVVDFGGSLGSTFFQNRSLFSTMHNIPVWNVIEQKHFVDYGRKEIPEINFYYTIEEFMKRNSNQSDVLLLSSVLEYMENPFEMLESLLNNDWKFVIIERSQYNPDDKDRLMIQAVPPSIYDAQYPLWLRSESKQHAIMTQKGYENILDWELPFSMPYRDEKGTRVLHFKGFLYKKKLKSCFYG